MNAEKQTLGVCFFCALKTGHYLLVPCVQNDLKLKRVVELCLMPSLPQFEKVVAGRFYLKLVWGETVDNSVAAGGLWNAARNAVRTNSVLSTLPDLKLQLLISFKIVIRNYPNFI